MHGHFHLVGGFALTVAGNNTSGQFELVVVSSAVEQRERPLVAVDAQVGELIFVTLKVVCLLYTSPSPRDLSTSRMPSSA